MEEKRKNLPRLVADTVTDELGHCMMHVQVYKEDGSVTEKTLAIEQYLNCLKNNLVVAEEPAVHIGRVPKNFFDGAVSSSGTRTGIFIVEPQKKGLCFGGKHFVIPFPKIVFFFCYNAEKDYFVERMAYCIVDKEVTPETKLYEYPFGNVSQGGGICFGNIHNRKIGSFLDFEDVIDDFFMSETNNDYYEVGRKNKSDLPQDKMLEKLTKLDAFPDSWLRETGDTFNKITKRLETKKN